MALVTYPLNDVDYQAEDAELFHCTRNSGIYAGDDFSCSCTGADNTLVIGPGVGWIRNSRFSGKVIALKADQAIDMGLTDSVYPRIDAVVLQFDANSNQTEVKVKKGTPSSVPAVPEIIRTESVYELHLFHVHREAGAASISVVDVTDLRMDANYCGLMADSVTEVDTSAINAQIMALIEKLRQDILAAKDGSAYLLRDGSVPMGGDLDMDGQRVTNVAAPEADCDAVNLGYANENFAPAGYGLGSMGGRAISFADIDTAKKFGLWALWDGGTINNIAFTFAKLLVIPLDMNAVTQILFPLGLSDCLLIRSCTGGIWGPWGCDNPPMLPGVEYRTTDGHYTMLVETGTLVAGRNVVTFENIWPAEVVDFRGNIGRQCCFPSIYGTVDSEYSVYAHVAKSFATIDVSIFVGSHHAGKTAKVQVWYTKD